MAIDSREKRASVVGVNYISAASVTPNSGKDQEWRQESGWGYPGILADNPTPSTGFSIIDLYYRTLLSNR